MQLRERGGGEVCCCITSPFQAPQNLRMNLWHEQPKYSTTKLCLQLWFLAWYSPEPACGVCCIRLSKPATGGGSAQIPALPVSAAFVPFLKSCRNKGKATLRMRYCLRCFSGLLTPILELHPSTSPVQVNSKVTGNPILHSSSTSTSRCSQLCAEGLKYCSTETTALLLTLSTCTNLEERKRNQGVFFSYRNSLANPTPRQCPCNTPWQHHTKCNTARSCKPVTCFVIRDNRALAETETDPSSGFGNVLWFPFRIGFMDEGTVTEGEGTLVFLNIICTFGLECWPLRSAFPQLRGASEAGLQQASDMQQSHNYLSTRGNKI